VPKKTQKKTALKDTGERMVPEFHKGGLIYAEHLTRYLPAQKLVEGKTVLDIACGSGYGAKILAKHATKVYGVDVSKEAVLYAKSHFDGPNIEYLVGDAVQIPLPNHSVDVVTTFETIEHIKDYRKFMSEIKRVLKKDGLAIISTPNDLEFAEGNHFHIHEFTYDELLALIKKSFSFVNPYFQATWKYVAIGSDTILAKEGEVAMPTLNLSPLHRDQYLYFYLLCSNREITETIEPLGALGGHYSDRTLMMEHTAFTTKISDLETQIKELQKSKNQQVEELTTALKTANEELESIKNSKSYKFGTTVASIKRKIIH